MHPHALVHALVVVPPLALAHPRPHALALVPPPAHPHAHAVIASIRVVASIRIDAAQRNATTPAHRLLVTLAPLNRAPRAQR